MNKNSFCGVEHRRVTLRSVVLGGTLAILGLSVVVPVAVRMGASVASKAHVTPSDDVVLPSLTPWNYIGGCGAGGSGGGGGGGAKWVGTGATGGLIDVEIMNSATWSQTLKTNTFNVRLSGKPHWKLSLGLSAPWNSKDGQVQYQTNMPEKYAITGGIGDISADMGLTLGATGQMTASLALSLPVGQYDIKRGTDNASFYLPASHQNGSGLFGLTFTLSRTKDVEDGILMFDAGYSHPFAMRLISGENKYLDEYFPEGVPAELSDNPRFYYRFKWYGENDLGAYTPASISLSGFYGYRGVPGYVHSFGVTFSGKTGIGRINHWDPANYAPVIDPDHQMWAGSVNYGIEFSRRKFPIFVSLVKPIHDTSNPDAPWEWNQPDWKDFLYSWSFAIGIKSTMF